MRRIVLSLAVLGAASLGACSGGGSVLNSVGANSPDKVILTVVGSANVARVLPGAGLPISAVAVSGSQNGVLSNNNFRWSAMMVTSGSYTFNTTGQTKACAQVLQTPTGGTATPYAADFGIYIAIDPVNEANILFIPPTIIPAPAGSTIATHYPYCVVVTAMAGTITGTGLNTKFVPSGAVGSITVAVVDPQNPEQ
jgi:hypothetical protein